MKKLFKLLIIPLILLISGCIKNNSIENITIYTTSYPLEYITNRLYGNHSTIKSIYPNGVDIKEFEISDTLINDYNDNDLYIFNSLTKEKDYVPKMLNNNKNLKIIDATSDISYNYAIDELWLDPSNTLSLANNIYKGFKEYIVSNPVLISEIEENFNELKYELAQEEAKYREVLEQFKNKPVIINNDMLMFLNNYGLKVISLDNTNPDYQDNLKFVIDYINKGNTIKIITLENQQLDDTITNLKLTSIQLHDLSNLNDQQKDKYDYMSLLDENLEILKNQL